MDACNALIVDDEADIRELIEMTLLPLGVHCLPAETLSEARALLKHQSFNFCITDLRLPDGNGLELVAYIQKQRPNLPVAVITAHGNVESAVEALKLGAFDFVSKPFDLAVLRGMVATALRLNRTSERQSRPATTARPCWANRRRWRTCGADRQAGAQPGADPDQRRIRHR
jgi:two-component system response regulator PilR (NtrC family)